MIVMKFGGTSVGGAEQIKKVAGIVKSYINKKPVIVVSAVTKITDKLIESANAASHGKGNETLENIKKAHYEILEKLELDNSLIAHDIEELSKAINKIRDNKEIDSKILDNVQSFGERMSSKIVAAQLNKMNVNAQAFNAWDLGFVTTSEFGNAMAHRLLDLARENMKKFQEETGSLYNLEASPAEGTTYRFAKEDKKRFHVIDATKPLSDVNIELQKILDKLEK